MGRPIEWTNEKIEIEADELIVWAKKNDSLVMASCYGSRGYSYHDAIEWSEKNEKFRQAKRNAMTIIGARREHGALISDYDSAMVRSTMANYDPEHRAMLKEMKREQLIEEISGDETRKRLSDLLKEKSSVTESCG